MWGTAHKGTHSRCVYGLTPNRRLLSGSRRTEGVVSRSSPVMHFTRSPLNHTDVKGAQASCLSRLVLLKLYPTYESPGNFSEILI